MGMVYLVHFTPTRDNWQEQNKKQIRRFKGLWRDCDVRKILYFYSDYLIPKDKASTS